jgi:hypothetical protein
MTTDIQRIDRELRKLSAALKVEDDPEEQTLIRFQIDRYLGARYKLQKAEKKAKVGATA